MKRINMGVRQIIENDISQIYNDYHALFEKNISPHHNESFPDTILALTQLSRCLSTRTVPRCSTGESTVIIHTKTPPAKLLATYIIFDIPGSIHSLNHGAGCAEVPIKQPDILRCQQLLLSVGRVLLLNKTDSVALDIFLSRTRWINEGTHAYVYVISFAFPPRERSWALMKRTSMNHADNDMKEVLPSFSWRVMCPTSAPRKNTKNKSA